MQATAKPRDLYVVLHMNQTGNHLIAKLVAEKLS
jgi:hypothetical protein